MHLLNEIHEQPEVIQRLLNEQQTSVAQVAKAITDFDPAFICIAARGTSDHVAVYARYLFAYYTGMPVMLAMPSLHTLYQHPPNLGHALVIGISQSGQAEDVRHVLADAKQQGALTLSITNDSDSPLAQETDHHLAILAGKEVSVAATKTYTAQLTLVAMLVAALANQAEFSQNLHRLPELVRQTLKYSESIASWAQRYRYANHLIVIGRGFNYATAFEITLKVKELAYIGSEGYSEADFRHGPIAMLNQGTPLMLVAPKGTMLPLMMDLAEKSQQRGAELIIISNDAGMLQTGNQQMPIPTELPEVISPIVTIIPGQIFAMQQAAVRGYEVDQPRGLSKVTVTR